MDHRAILCECALFLLCKHKGFRLDLQRVIPIQLQQIKEQINVAAADKRRQRNITAAVLVDIPEISVALRVIFRLNGKVVIIAFQIPVLAGERIEHLLAAQQQGKATAQAVIKVGITAVGVEDRVCRVCFHALSDGIRQHPCLPECIGKKLRTDRLTAILHQVRSFLNIAVHFKKRAFLVWLQRTPQCIETTGKLVLPNLLPAELFQPAIPENHGLIQCSIIAKNSARIADWRKRLTIVIHRKRKITAVDLFHFARIRHACVHMEKRSVSDRLNFHPRLAGLRHMLQRPVVYAVGHQCRHTVQNLNLLCVPGQVLDRDHTKQRPNGCIGQQAVAHFCFKAVCLIVVRHDDGIRCHCKRLLFVCLTERLIGAALGADKCPEACAANVLIRRVCRVKFHDGMVFILRTETDDPLPAIYIVAPERYAVYARDPR